MRSNLIKLPQVTFSFEKALPEHQYLFITGGRPPLNSWLRTAAKDCIIWCIDRGIDSCRSAGLIPEHLFGDGDSASKEGWDWAVSQKIPIEKYQSEKDFTDTQLALEYASRDPEAMVVLTGCFGKRFDHLYSTFFSCSHSKMPICLADEQEVLFPLTSGNELTIIPERRPLALSLLPITAVCSGVNITNVRWPLQNAELNQAFPNAVSNRIKGEAPVRVSLSDGILGVYMYWENQSL